MKHQTKSSTFEVFGPFDIPRTPTRTGRSRQITKEAIIELAPELEEQCEGLSDACGCYVFAMRAAKGYRPWYVGQAAKSSILKEALNPSNREKYNSVSDGKGTPVLFVLPLMTPNGKFRKRRKVDGGLEKLYFLEDWLIATALQKNPDLRNNRKTRHLREVRVPGILNSGQGSSTKESRALRKALFRK